MCKNQEFVLAFWGDNEALTATKSPDCKILFKRSRYSNRAVNNSHRDTIALIKQSYKRQNKIKTMLKY